MTQTTKGLAALVIIGRLLILAGCGDDDTDTATSSTTSTNIIIHIDSRIDHDRDTDNRPLLATRVPLRRCVPQKAQ